VAVPPQVRKRGDEEMRNSFVSNGSTGISTFKKSQYSGLFSSSSTVVFVCRALSQGNFSVMKPEGEKRKVTTGGER